MGGQIKNNMSISLNMNFQQIKLYFNYFLRIGLSLLIFFISIAGFLTYWLRGVVLVIIAILILPKVYGYIKHLITQKYKLNESVYKIWFGLIAFLVTIGTFGVSLSEIKPDPNYRIDKENNQIKSLKDSLEGVKKKRLIFLKMFLKKKKK